MKSAIPAIEAALTIIAAVILGWTIATAVELIGQSQTCDAVCEMELFP